MAGAWPNVTLPHFTERVDEAVRLTGSELFAFLPIVLAEQKASFEEYAAAEWAKNLESWTLEGVQEGWIPEEIHDIEGASVTGSQQEFYVPLWQVAPEARYLNVLLLDMDSFPWFHQLELAAREVQRPVMSGMVDVEYLFDATREKELMEWHPRSIILQEVPKSMEQIEDNLIDETERGGFVFAVLPWERYFKNVIPAGLYGFVVVVDDHCGSVVTYRIDGREATIIGKGNLHDPKYDYLHMEADFASSAQYDGQDTSVDHCYYIISVYPTDELKDLYSSSKPFLFAIAILGVFLFTTGIFYCYDMAVERRQRHIARIAKRTNNIVKSLFPKNVQERIMAEAREDAEKAEQAERGRGKGAFHVSMKDRLKETLSSQSDRNDQSYKNVPPIADLFPSTTVMFAVSYVCEENHGWSVHSLP